MLFPLPFLFHLFLNLWLKNKMSLCRSRTKERRDLSGWLIMDLSRTLGNDFITNQ